MPYRYVLTDHAFTAFLVLSARERRSLLSAFEQLTENPVGLSEGVDFDWDGDPAYTVRHGIFVIGYRVEVNSRILAITMIRPYRP